MDSFGGVFDNILRRFMKFIMLTIAMAMFTVFMAGFLRCYQTLYTYEWVILIGWPQLSIFSFFHFLDLWGLKKVKRLYSYALQEIFV